MNADERRSRLNVITESVIGCAMRVSNTLGAGFLEKVYENALLIEARTAGLRVEAQRSLRVRYAGEIVGEYQADLLFEESVIAEVKAVRALEPAHQAQCMNYLKASGLNICLLLNFGNPKLEIKRIVHDF